MGDEVLDECMRERYGLAKERIREIRTEETVKEPFGDFFRKMAQFLSMTADVMDEESVELTLEELKERNHHFYQDILPENYESSYGNPAYAVNKLGDYGKAFSFLYAELAGTVAYAHEKRLWDMTVSMELFLEVYSAFCEEELPEAATVEGILRSYVNDYCQDMMEQRIGSYRDKNDCFFISHGDSQEDAEYVRDLVRERFGIESCIINYVGPTIGAHSGPGTIALFFLGDYR